MQVDSGDQGPGEMTTLSQEDPGPLRLGTKGKYTEIPVSFSLPTSWGSSALAKSNQKLWKEEPFVAMCTA